MNQVLARWNSLDPVTAAREALPCCGSQAWALALASKRPFTDTASVAEASTTVWFALPREAWQEAFDSHPPHRAEACTIICNRRVFAMVRSRTTHCVVNG